MNYIFYGITMKDYRGRTLYLKCSDRETKDPYKILMSWTFNVNEACLWETYTDCMKFAKNYFKNFTKYNINTITIHERSLKTHDEGAVV